MTYEDFIGKFENRRNTDRGCMVRCPAHEDSTASLSIGRAKDGGVVLKCFANCATESVVASLGLEMKDLFAKELERQFTPRYKPLPSRNGNGHVEKVKPTIDKTYSYTDALGRELYQAVRLKPKDFRQRHAVGGQWVWTMDGVERVLYRLPEVLKADDVWVVEGEKDANNLAELGFCATCNVGGAGKWLDGYTETLKGKRVVICGDNDAPGKKHVGMVFDSIATKAQTVKVITLPTIYKDASELIEAIGEGAKAVLAELESAAVPHVGGVRMPIYSMADIQPRYHKLVTMPEGTRIDLGDWLPTFKGRLRPLTPGTVVLVQGSTGIGKTIFLQCVAMQFAKVKSLMFEMELPDEDLFERFWANQQGMDCVDVEKHFKLFGQFSAEEVMKHFPNLFICPESRLTLEQFEAIILKSELKMGGKPVIVLADYGQLLIGTGNTRYERASSVAEGIKIIAKATQTIIFVASQVDRASAKDDEIGLHSAKDSGSWEQSAGLVLAARRDKKDRTLLHLKVVKATKGGAGLEIECNFDGARAMITERSKVSENDVPHND